MNDDEIAALWTAARPRILARVAVLESAAAAAVSGDLTADLRAEAESEAHKLAGSLGMFGFRDGSRVALAIEQALEGDGPVTGSALAEQVRDLIASMDGSP